MNWLTTGFGGTALACYLDVLKKDSKNVTALKGLNDIAAKYERWINRALQKGQKDKAARYLVGLKKVSPESPNVLAFQEQIDGIVLPSPLPSSSRNFRDYLKDGSLGPEMVWIPGGSFRMGDIQGGGSLNEKPVHRVTISRFAMGKYEVTVGEFKKFVKSTGYKTDAEKGGSCWTWQNGWKKVKGANWRNPRFEQNDRHPVVCVSWNDAVAYSKWLSKQTGKNYRLPTESEWEYAARGGTKTKYWWGNKIGKNKANCWNSDCKDKFEYTASVGSFSLNPYGINDTVGNVWEWCLDKYHENYKGAPIDGSAWERGGEAYRVLRGGSWDDNPANVRTANRGRGTSGNRNDSCGFRVAFARDL